jgi:hypothetical protein
VALVAILGMHRSGTSAVAAMLAEHGVEFGSVRMRNRFNRRGNRELPELNRLHEELLERSGGSWWDPPDEVPARPEDISRRDEILATVRGETTGVKDPRMLVCPELWRDLELRRIGVIRNPVSVRKSLARRAEERPRRHPRYSAQEWEELWVRYNRSLLAEHGRSPFPLIDFDRHDELNRQVAAALAFWGLEAGGDSTVFDRSLIQQRSEAGWRAEAASPLAVELWDTLSGLATA